MLAPVAAARATRNHVADAVRRAQAPPQDAVATGGPGAQVDWAPADKHGFGTSTTLTSMVWFTLEGGELTEVYFPRLDTPSLRDLQFVVTDGRSFAEAERDSTVQQTVQTDPRSLSYTQVNTDRRRRWRPIKSYVTDPRRATLLRACTTPACAPAIVCSPETDRWAAPSSPPPPSRSRRAGTRPRAAIR